MLFKEARTAMVINGPWPWAAYHIPETAIVAPLPKNTETGFWCEPMISAKGYSVNAATKPEKFAIIRELIEYLTSAKVQEEMATRLFTTPVALEALKSDRLQTHQALQASIAQIAHGRPMPIMPTMRAVREGMRGPYQL
jgi:maltose-binding protein MalE